MSAGAVDVAATVEERADAAAAAAAAAAGVVVKARAVMGIPMGIPAGIPAGVSRRAAARMRSMLDGVVGARDTSSHEEAEGSGGPAEHTEPDGEGCGQEDVRRGCNGWLVSRGSLCTYLMGWSESVSSKYSGHFCTRKVSWRLLHVSLSLAGCGTAVDFTEVSPLLPPLPHPNAHLHPHRPRRPRGSSESKREKNRTTGTCQSHRGCLAWTAPTSLPPQQR